MWINILCICVLGDILLNEKDKNVERIKRDGGKYLSDHKLFVNINVN